MSVTRNLPSRITSAVSDAPNPPDDSERTHRSGHPARNAADPLPRERLFSDGAERLSDAELLAILLGTGWHREPVRVLASRVLHDVEGLRGLERRGAKELALIPGLGPTKAARIHAAIELGVRLHTLPLTRGEPLCSSSDVHAALRGRLGRSSVEEFIAIPLDAKNRPQGELRLARGGRSACPVDPAEVFRRLLRESASGVIFAHNHPSGDPAPSPEDIELTARLRDGGALLGVRVLDHVIVAATGYFSFRDAGWLGEDDALP